MGGKIQPVSGGLRVGTIDQGEGRQRRVTPINEEPWEPLPGMVKRRCGGCRCWFAAPVSSRTSLCPECARGA